MKTRGKRGKNPETILLESIREALAYEPGLMLMRNSVGTGRGHVHHGLGTGSADLVGVLHGRVPQLLGRFVALEVKTESGTVEPEQSVWLERVRQHGGFACIVRSVGEARAAILRARHGDSW